MFKMRAEFQECELNIAPLAKICELCQSASQNENHLQPQCVDNTFYKENKMSKNSYADARLKQKVCESYSEEPSESNTE